MPKNYHDFVIYNANIITMEENNPTAEMIGISNDKISYIGDFKKKILQSALNTLDLSKKTIIPGFIDLHTHLWKESHVISIDLSRYSTYKDVIERLETEVEKKKPGEWIFASNWDESRWDKKIFLKLADLDIIAPKNPLYTQREDGHLCVANSLALEKLQIANHPGAEKDSFGNLTGILKDVWLDLSPYYKEKIPDSIEKSAYIAASKGITTVIDNLTIMSEGQKNVMNAYFSLDFKEKLPIRIFLNPTRELMQEFCNIGIKQNWGSSNVRFSGFKGFFDGALGAHTALLNEHYCDYESFGEKFLDEKELISQITFAEQNDYTMCIHAIGDLAIEKLLDCYEIGIKNAGRIKSSRKHRIEHAEMISDEQIQRALNLGIYLSMQPNFLKWEYPGDLYEKRLGKKRFMTLNRFARILEIGSYVNFGSDNMPLSPLFGIKQATTFPSEDIQISIEEALRAYTIHNAQVLFMDHMIGSLKEGKYADLVIMTDSPFNISPSDLNDELIDITMVGGNIVYHSGK